MTYFSQMTIEIKERFGHVLQERGLVMRGNGDKDLLTLVFKKDNDPEGSILPVELHIPGRSATGAKIATWEEVTLEAMIHEEVIIGDSGYRGYVHRQDDTVHFSDFDNLEEFFASIEAYLRDVVIVPWEATENVVCEEVAAAYSALETAVKPSAPQAPYKNENGVESLTIEDARGKTLRFAYVNEACTAEVSIDGEMIGRVKYPSHWEITQMIEQNFTRETDLSLSR